MDQMSSRLVIGLQTFADITSWQTGQRLLAPLFASDALRPDKAATMGEVTARHGVVVQMLADCEPLWGRAAQLRAGNVSHSFAAPFSWRSKGKSKGHVSFPSTDHRGKPVPGWLVFEARPSPGTDWLALFSDWCAALAPFAAMLHPAIHLEGSKGKSPVITLADEISAATEAQFQAGTPWCKLTAGPLNSTFSGLTNLAWANYLGGSFAPEVDEAAIRRAGFDVDRQGNGCLIRVTPRITDVAADFASFEDRRSALRSCFREGLFLVAD
ncbi:MAG: hypothetical protein CFE34_10915 [Rhodobacteraceae bacterium PARR1]|nr:MAG: hypothetical protein CFE34_10915 [Rhodobacteraceae bacterium PARR1]